MKTQDPKTQEPRAETESLVSCPSCGTTGFTPRGLKAHRCKGVNRNPAAEAAQGTGEAEVVSAGAVSRAELGQIAGDIDSIIDMIAGHEEAFEEATLEHRLLVGLHVSRAMEVFVMTPSEKGKLGGRPSESLSRRDKLIPEQPHVLSNSGFLQWLCKEVPRLKRPTAYKYAQAFRGLALPAGAGMTQIRARIKDLRHQAGKAHLPMPRLADLVKAGKPPKPQSRALILPPDTAQLRLEDARETFHTWREDFETAVRQGQLDDLDEKGLRQMKEFLLGARDRVNARLK